MPLSMTHNTRDRLLQCSLPSRPQIQTAQHEPLKVVLNRDAGHIVFHGPREDVVEFFESCGFRCPERKGVPDFLQEVTSVNDQKVGLLRFYSFTPNAHMKLACKLGFQACYV